MKTIPILYTGEQFKELRRRLNISAADLSRASGVSQSAISRYEAGQCDLKITNYKRLVTAMYRLRKGVV